MTAAICRASGMHDGQGQTLLGRHAAKVGMSKPHSAAAHPVRQLLHHGIGLGAQCVECDFGVGLDLAGAGFPAGCAGSGREDAGERIRGGTVRRHPPAHWSSGAPPAKLEAADQAVTVALDAGARYVTPG